MKYFFVVFIFLSASGILWASYVPLKNFHGASALRIYALVQYVAGLALIFFGK